MDNKNCIWKIAKREAEWPPNVYLMNFTTNWAKKYFDNDDTSLKVLKSFMGWHGDVFAYHGASALNDKMKPEDVTLCQNNRMHFRSTMALCNL